MPLATLLAGPFMALFANMLDVETTLHVLDRVIIYGKPALLSIVKHVFRGMRLELLSKSELTLQPYLIKQVYVDALANDCFFPPIL